VTPFTAGQQAKGHWIRCVVFWSWLLFYISGYFQTISTWTVFLHFVGFIYNCGVLL